MRDVSRRGLGFKGLVKWGQSKAEEMESDPKWLAKWGVIPTAFGCPQGKSLKHRGLTPNLVARG